jgi:hypothetical protein
VKYQPLTPEEITALQSYAAYAGRTWKMQLRMAWENARMPGLLHKLRNSHGPSWLISFRLPKARIVPWDESACMGNRD